MFEYHIVHHVHGRIRVKVPWMKRLTLSQLAELSAIPLDRGILDIRPNWLAGTLVIYYNPKEINIMEHLKTLASSPKIESIFGTERSN